MKRIKRLVMAVVAVVILVVVGAVIWTDQLAKAGVEAGGTFAFGVPTKLDSASIGILTGRSKLSRLGIANPDGFETPHLLHLDDAVVAVSLGSLTSDTIEIPEFSLTGIDVNLERKGGSANFSKVLDNLGRFESSRKEPQPQQTDGDGKKFIIREILIKDIKVNMALLPIGGAATRMTVPIEELRLKDVGSGTAGGAVLGQVAGTVLKAIILAAVEKGGAAIPSELLNELNGAMANLAPLKEIGASLAVNVDGKLKDLSAQAGAIGGQFTQQAEGAVQQAETAIRQVEGAAQQIGDSVKGAQQNLTEGLGGLLKKKEDKPH
jgi:uncharacterized protein involved in outer membrane biogenesis